MIKTLLIIILSIQILSVSVPDQDTTNPKILTAHDTVSDTIGVSEIISGTFYLNDQQEELNNDSNSSRVSSRCVLDCNLMIQLIAVMIAIIALLLSIRQSKQSSDQADKSYNAFITKSDKQFNAQKETLETIKKQTDKIYSDNNKRDFVGYLSECSTSVKLVSNYLQDNFSNIIWKVDIKDYVFDLLQPVIKSATALKISLASIEKKDDNFVKAIKICSELGERELKDRIEVELLIKELNDCKLVFESYINQ